MLSLNRPVTPIGTDSHVGYPWASGIRRKTKQKAKKREENSALRSPESPGLSGIHLQDETC
jgi:hypothetical protein